MQKLLPASIALALAFPIGAMADTQSDVTALRKEMQAMRADYEARLKALEQRVQAAEARPAPPAATSAPGWTAPAPATGVAAVAAPAPVAAAPAESVAATPGTGGGAANSFNPALSLILSGAYTNASRDPKSYSIRGFPLPPDAEIGPGSRSFSLGETELGFAANIDPWLRGQANIALEADNSVSIEEAFVETTALGNGLSLRGGRFFSGVGYLNSQHSHTWDFTDAPLAYQAMLGTQYDDDGVQLKWIPPIDQYVELGAELGRGRSFPGNAVDSNGAGMYALTLHTGGDVGISNNWRAGISMLSAKADNQELLATDAANTPFTSAFTGNSRVWVLDGVWKWAPNGNATRTNFKLQGEYLRSDRSGSIAGDADGAAFAAPYGVLQSGAYLQAVYQFMPRWRVGLRTERLDAGTPTLGLNTALDSNYNPSKNSVMVDFNPSEFSRIRLQYAQDRAREGKPDNQITLQYQMSLGAHGAHSY